MRIRRVFEDFARYCTLYTTWRFVENGTLPLLYAGKGNSSRDLISGTCGTIEVSQRFER